MLRIVTAGVEIAVLSVVFYYTMIFFRQTGAVQALRGLAILGIGFVLARVFRLDVLSSLFVRGFPFLFLAIVIIFQGELRRALSELGRRRLFSGVSAGAVKEVIGAVTELSRKKIGGLIAIERDIGLGNWAQSGVPVNGRVSKELLLSIFIPSGPLHDGGVIIQGDKITVAACLFPFSKKREIGSSLGMRHKAALGLAEESDAVIIVVSEETGTISAAFAGRMVRNLDEEGLKDLLGKNLHYKKGHSGTG